MEHLDEQLRRVGVELEKEVSESGWADLAREMELRLWVARAAFTTEAEAAR